VQSDPTPTNPKQEPKAPASSGFPREFSPVIPLLVPAPVGLVRSGHTDLPASQGGAQIQDEASPQVVYLLVAGKKVLDNNIAKNPRACPSADTNSRPLIVVLGKPYITLERSRGPVTNQRSLTWHFV
jgi:hypothetical protein